MRDCLVIGGGLIGMLTARELCAARLSVTIVEQGQCGQESSWAGGGILSPLYPWRYDEAVTALANWGQAVYPNLISSIYKETGLDPELEQNGLMILHADNNQAAVDWGLRFGRNVSEITPVQIQELAPELGEVPDSAIWMPDVGHVRNPRFIKAIKESLLKQGVNILENTSVKKLSIKKGQIDGVMLEGETLTANTVIVAGGAWSSNLLAETGVTLPVRPVRGQMLLYRAKPGVVSRILLSRDRYLIPRRDGRVLIGSTLEETGFDKSTTEQAREELQQEAQRLVPALANYEVEHHWAGLRPGSPTGIPYIGEHPLVKNLYVNSGHFRNGVVLGLASAHLLTDIMLMRNPVIDPQVYKILINQ
ncbi:MAG: glycine oxidase ThiO [Gammaproteobacteria bacterium]|nr:glycine oxidase ThiO [Gammaproteobacteria bacterium]